MCEVIFEAFVILLLLAFLLTVYFLPTIYAKMHKHPQIEAIFVVNLFLGWTLVGWVIALAWSAIVSPPIQHRK